MLRYARALLERWGAYIERHQADQHGLPKIEAAYAARMGRGGGNAGHRVLCSDPPRPIWVCDYVVGRLPEAEKQALHAWHVIRMKPDNTVWDQREKAEALQINYGTFRVRVHRGTKHVADALSVILI